MAVGHRSFTSALVLLRVRWFFFLGLLSLVLYKLTRNILDNLSTRMAASCWIVDEL